MGPAQKLFKKFIAEGDLRNGTSLLVNAANFVSRYPLEAAAAGIHEETQIIRLRNRANSGRLFVVNRTGQVDDEHWLHIVPKGDLVNERAAITQVLDEKALDSILDNIVAERRRMGANWPGVYLGEEHFIYDPDKSSAAFGWLKTFQKRDDGIWAKDDGLTDLGREAIRNNRFKYTSFCADPGDVEKLGNNRVRILKIETVGLTNFANGRDMLTPITNRADFAERQNAIVDRALEIIEKSPIDLRLAINQASKELEFQAPQPGSDEYIALAKKIADRVKEIMKSDPNMSASRAAQQAHNEAPIVNRAKQLLRDNPRASAYGAFRQSAQEAQRDSDADSTKIMNRAKEIQRETRMPFGTCVIEAQREAGHQI